MEERYETVDLPFYEKEIIPALPPVVLDFHTHIWTGEERACERGRVVDKGAAPRALLIEEARDGLPTLAEQLAR